MVIFLLVVIGLAFAATGDSVTNAGLPGAVVFNQMAESESIQVWRRTSIAVCMALGLQTGYEEDGKWPKFDRSEYLKGNKIEMPFETGVPTMTGVLSAEQDDADTAAASEENYNQMFDIAHYEGKIGIGKRSIRQYNGASREGKIKWIEETYRKAEGARCKTMQLALNETSGTPAPAENRMGSMWHAVDDGSLFDAYGQITRATAGNEDFRPAFQENNVGQLDRDVLGYAMGESEIRDGEPSLGISCNAVNNEVRAMLEGFLEAVVNGPYVEFSKRMFRYGGVDFGKEAYAPSGGLLILDPRGWKSWFTKDKMTTDGLVRDITKKAWYVLPFDIMGQVLCKRVNWQIKLMGITTARG